ncbi:unnamed protein product, partial [Didymodactylos carnosus]
NHWEEFQVWTKELKKFDIRRQASMGDYKNIELMCNVIKKLDIERLSEAYAFLHSANSTIADDIFLKHNIHLVVCPISDVYNRANVRTIEVENIKSPVEEQPRKSEIKNKSNHRLKFCRSTSFVQCSSLDALMTEAINSKLAKSGKKRLNDYQLLNKCQSGIINYSITSLCPNNYGQNLSEIYKDLFLNNNFTCEHMQYLNENAIKSSFASQQIKTDLIKYLR